LTAAKAGAACPHKTLEMDSETAAAWSLRRAEIEAQAETV
jgi:hypothetical protein